jgi:rod shape determining protein RodA
MYSSGYDHGTRFVDHGRNMLIRRSGHAAGRIRDVRGGAGSAPAPDGLAVPLYVLGVALLVAVALFGITKKGAHALAERGHGHPAQRDLKIAMPLMLAWWFQKREGQLRPLDFLVAGLLLAVPVG